MSWDLFRQSLKSSARATLVVFAVIAFYVAAVVSMFDPALGESLDAMMAAMPEMFAAFGMGTATTTLVGFLINYLQGFLLTMVPLVLIVLLVNKLLARPLDDGSLACLLSMPLSRRSIIVTLMASTLASLALLLAATTLCEIVCSEVLFPGDLDVMGLVWANVGIFALWMFMTGICYLAACLCSRAGTSMALGGGVFVVFYLVQMVSQIGDGLSWLEGMTPLSLYDAYALAAQDPAACVTACVLALIGLAALAVAALVFCRRDLSV